MKQITIEIHNGSVQLDFKGFEGKSCTELEEKIRPENLLIQEVTLKPEYELEPLDSQVNTSCIDA
ncbi:MAG: hypothetical protein C9356_15135 [Oleiphilus sp.]|nr:MAG: hypothetical protein C9356_15135 [Oleiphilus sp.]